MNVVTKEKYEEMSKLASGLGEYMKELQKKCKAPKQEKKKKQSFKSFIIIKPDS